MYQPAITSIYTNIA